MATLPTQDTPQVNAVETDAELAAKEILKEVKTQVESCKKYRSKLAQKWDTRIEYRRGKPFATSTDSDRINVNIDWSMTKVKQSALFSQVPKIRVNHPPQTFTLPWVHAYEQRVNDTMTTAGIESIMEEVLPDCINAAGFGAAIVAREVLADELEVPSIDLSFFQPEERDLILSAKILPDGTPLPTTTVPRVLDQRYTITRISPKDFLWPIDFDGSDFERAPWLGRSGRMSWTEAKKRFNLKEEEKQRYISNPNENSLTQRDPEKEQYTPSNTVAFDEIFYKDYQFNAAATSFSTIQHVIFLGAEKKPVVNEPWKGQIVSQDGSILGCAKFPIRVLTLTYLTDEAIPPSDSAIIGPQVDELNSLRTLAVLQRKHSLPGRWIDVNRIDPAIQIGLMRGAWQPIIPVQGGGANAIGSIQTSAMPQENYGFEKTVRSDINELMMLGPAPRLAGEDRERPAAYESMSAARLTKERARVSKFVTDIAETLGGLLCISENPASFGDGFDPAISKTLAYSIITDSTVLMGANERLQQLFQFINFTAKSGYVNIEAVLKEIATLSGLDPNVVIQKPQPRPPAEPNISLRLTGTEDLLNPMVVAMLMSQGQLPPDQYLDKAKDYIEKAVTPTNNMPLNPLLLAQMLKAGQLNPDGMLPPAQDANPWPDLPMQGPSTPVGQANPDWGSLDRINKRVQDQEGK